MRIVFMGTPAFSVPALDALVAAGHDIVAVYCQPPRPAGRGKKERSGPVQRRATELGLAVCYPQSLRSTEAQKTFAAHAADVAVVVAYGLILPDSILDAPRRGCLNIHASLLPRWRGAAPIHRAIMAGDVETGVCIMQMDAGLDTGAVLMRRVVPIAPQETTGLLHDRLAQQGATLIVETLAASGAFEPVAQTEIGATYAKKIDKSEARVDWMKSATEIDRQIRGLSPFPGAWCEISGERVKILGSRAVPGFGAPGTVLQGFSVACGQDAVEITMAQRSGKKPMKALDFLRGSRLPARLE